MTSTAEVLILDEIGFWGITAADFTAEVNALDVDTLDVRINSPGGSVYDGIGSTARSVGTARRCTSPSTASPRASPA
jgi:hypothetical protein